MASKDHVPRPHFEWEPGSHGLEDILKTHALPVIVQCDITNCGYRLETLNFDMTQPLLLDTRRSRVVRTAANSVLYDKATKSFKDVGDVILIPNDYKGWFAVLGNPDDNKENRSVPHYRQVEQLVLSKCEQFLIGGSEIVEALQIRREKETSYLPRHFSPGDVLKKRNLYQATIQIKSKGFGSKSKLIKNQFLMCTDDQDREFLLPLEQRGMFYMISGYSSSATLPILQLSDITERFKYPCLVKLVYGRVPTTPCSFTGVLLLRDSYVESSVIASTVINLKNVLLELPLNLPLKFRVAVKSFQLLSNPAYKAAMAFCKATAETYSRSMKTSQIIPEYPTSKESKSGSKKVKDTTEAEETHKVRLSGATADEDFNTGEYEEVWCQKLHAPIVSSTDRTSRFNMGVPLDQPVGALRFPQTRQTGFVNRDITTDEQDHNRRTESVYLNWTPNSSDSLEENYSSNYQNVIPSISPYNTFIFYEGYGSDHQTTDDSSLEYLTPIPEKKSIYQNITSLKMLPVSELSQSEKCQVGYAKTMPANLNRESNKTPHEHKTIYKTAVDVKRRSCTSVVDDLPLGADSSFFTRRPVSLGADSGVDSEGTFQGESHLSRLSVSELSDRLTQIGVKKTVIAKMRKELVDGSLLEKFDQDELRESFPDITYIDMKKISLCMQGWSPKS